MRAFHAKGTGAKAEFHILSTVTLLLNQWTLLPKLFMRLRLRAVVVIYRLMEFTPWHTTENFRPLGSLNRAKKRVYYASQALRATST